VAAVEQMKAASELAATHSNEESVVTFDVPPSSMRLEQYQSEKEKVNRSPNSATK
jgi:hypothetical protein